jgi:hypothetical protein
MKTTKFTQIMLATAVTGLMAAGLHAGGYADKLGAESDAALAEILQKAEQRKILNELKEQTRLLRSQEPTSPILNP